MIKPLLSPLELPKSIIYMFVERIVKKQYQKQCFFHAGMQSRSNMIHCRTAGEKLNSFCGMTPSILSPRTDLLILKGQTGPIHNVILECSGLSFHCNEKAIYWGDSCGGSICFPPVLDFLLLLWQTHLVSCHLRLIFHRLDMFPI